MGTRALVVVKEDDEVLAVIYNHWDGYPSGLGKDLADFLKGKTLINGIGLDQHADAFANGMGCLAAQLIAHLKTQIGSIYMYPVSAIDDKNGWEEYVYTVYDKDTRIRLKAQTRAGALIYDGYAENFDSDRAEAKVNKIYEEG